MTVSEQCADLIQTTRTLSQQLETLKELLMGLERPDFDLDAWNEEQGEKKFYEEQTGLR